MRQQGYKLRDIWSVTAFMVVLALFCLSPLQTTARAQTNSGGNLTLSATLTASSKPLTSGFVGASMLTLLKRTAQEPCSRNLT